MSKVKIYITTSGMGYGKFRSLLKLDGNKYLVLFDSSELGYYYSSVGTIENYENYEIEESKTFDFTDDKLRNYVDYNIINLLKLYIEK